jgi:hypothetical protein
MLEPDKPLIKEYEQINTEEIIIKLKEILAYLQKIRSNENE